MLSQVSPEEIVFGEVLWAACKGFFGVLGVIIVASFIAAYRELEGFRIDDLEDVEVEKE